MKTSVIISVYKNTSALKAVLDSLKNQTFKDFEIIISEDAQGDAMRQFVEEYPFCNPHLHLTQKDLGWRKNRALNRAIAQSNGDWLIFIDGDCVLHPRFVEFHTRLAQDGHILAGKRVKLNAFHSQMLMRDLDYMQSLNNILTKQALALKRKKGNKFCEEGIFMDPDKLPLGIIPRLRRMSMLKGCNMSFAKEAIYAINGFDMDYVRPAVGEDVDLCWRFKATGYKVISLRNMAVQYHLFHKENWSDQSENLLLMKGKQSASEVVCRNGIAQLDGAQD